MKLTMDDIELITESLLIRTCRDCCSSFYCEINETLKCVEICERLKRAMMGEET